MKILYNKLFFAANREDPERISCPNNAISEIRSSELWQLAAHYVGIYRLVSQLQL